jgi:RNA polymerase sigma-70 factor (ECF subfamily)
MRDEDRAQRLSQIQTLWSELRRAHLGEGEEASDTRGQLLERYSGAVQRYLRAILRQAAPGADHEDLAWELTQEFAVKFLRGGFRGADPARGRFRDLVKRALRNLVIDHWRRRAREPVNLPEDPEGLAAHLQTTDDPDRAFLDAWREEVLQQAWDALQRGEEESGAPYYSVLCCHLEQGLTAAQTAAELGPRFGKTFSPDAIRQIRTRARDKLADLLIDEVARSLETEELEQVQEELIELGLYELASCREALERRRARS